MIRILSEKEIKKLAQLDLDVIAAIESGFGKLAEGNATVPPIMMIPVHEKDGEVDIKSAFIKGIPNLAVKVASGFFRTRRSGSPLKVDRCWSSVPRPAFLKPSCWTMAT